MFALSGAFGALAGRIGPRIPLTVGPVIGAGGLSFLLGVGPGSEYVTEILPAMLLFGLGLAVTVAPLTTTVLNSVEERHAGIASGVNNAVARVAGLLAIAALGAVISAQFASNLDDRLEQSGAAAAEVVAEAKEQPLAGGDVRGLPADDGEALAADITDSSTSAFHLGVGIGAGLMVLGGLIALLGVRNPERAPEPGAEHAPGAAAAAGECGRPADPRPAATGVPGSLAPEPARSGGEPLL
jgi:hypothetical protein